MIKKPGEELGDGDVCIKEDGTLEYKVWIKTGSMMYNRECLGLEDPLCLYNLLVDNNLSPENYGIEHPHTREFKDWSKEKLIREVVQLRKELEAKYRAGF